MPVITLTIIFIFLSKTPQVFKKKRVRAVSCIIYLQMMQHINIEVSHDIEQITRCKIDIFFESSLFHFHPYFPWESLSFYVYVHIAFAKPLSKEKGRTDFLVI